MSRNKSSKNTQERYTHKICGGNLNNREIDHVHEQKYSIVKMSVFLKLTCRFNEIPIKIPIGFFIVFDKMNSQGTSGSEKQK